MPERICTMHPRRSFLHSAADGVRSLSLECISSECGSSKEYGLLTVMKKRSERLQEGITLHILRLQGLWMRLDAKISPWKVRLWGLIGCVAQIFNVRVCN
jgi:hypothetical protein